MYLVAGRCHRAPRCRAPCCASAFAVRGCLYPFSLLLSPCLLRAPLYIRHRRPGSSLCTSSPEKAQARYGLNTASKISAAGRGVGRGCPTTLRLVLRSEVPSLLRRVASGPLRSTSSPPAFASVLRHPTAGGPRSARPSAPASVRGQGGGSPPQGIRSPAL